MTYRIAGMDNFQQSGRKTSFPSRRKRYNNTLGFQSELPDAPFGEQQSRRRNATVSEMKPFKSSVKSTADEAEYVCWGAVDTRE